MADIIAERVSHDKSKHVISDKNRDKNRDNGGMANASGLREAHRLATKQALQEAAERLFAEQGYTLTTVQDIATAVGVTERTFFRYFASKEELIVDDALGWVGTLQDKIRARPVKEDTLTALRRAVADLASGMARSDRPSPVWLFSEGPPGERIRRSMRGAIVRVEAGLSAVIRERLELHDNTTGMELDYLADILARATFALLRAALIRCSQLQREGPRWRPSPKALVEQAFSILQIPPSGPRGSVERRRHQDG